MHRGAEWIAKFGDEAQPETAAVHLLYGLGYKTEITYLLPGPTKIPGKGTFQNVRLVCSPSTCQKARRMEMAQRNPFTGTNELQGLKIMMVFFDQLGPPGYAEQGAAGDQRRHNRESVCHQ